jgi:hypothetical protein
MGQTFKLEGPMKQAALRQSDMFPLLDYKKKGCEAEYAGETTVKGEKAHKLAFVYPEGDTTHFYFDAEKFHILKEEGRDGAKSWSNYKESGNILWPRKLTIASPQGQQMMTFDSIAVNIEVPDSLFVMPADAQPMPGTTPPPADSSEPADTGK